MKTNNYSKTKLPHQFYKLKKLITKPALYAVVVVLSFLLTSTKVSAQADDKPFTLRTSQQAPGDFAGKQIYTVKGDFVMLGNTNVSITKDAMADYIKLPNEPVGILNSSSADFNLPSTINNACTKIIFAGLYWTGQVHALPNTLNIKTVKFKTPAMNAYKDLSTTGDISFGANQGSIYAGYCDVTNLVQAGGVGTYAVANIGPNDHTTGGIAGWGLVIIYENATLPLKNIGVFDGYSYVGPSVNKQIDLNGFRTNQSGPVKIKLGLMSAVGNQNQADIFQIKKRSSNAWFTLSHSLNSTFDFFNGSILTGGNNRIPNHGDNGFDLVVFDVPNENNQILDNNQTSTSFLGQGIGDEYALYNVTFAFDAYVPLITAVNKSNNSLETKASVSPGQELEFEIDLYNKGNEALKNTAVEITLPQNVTFVSSEFTKGGNVISSPPDISNLTDAKNSTIAHKVKWNIADLEVPTDAATIVGKLKYKVKISDNCFLLTSDLNPYFKAIAINGKIAGTGAVSGADFDYKLAIGYTPGTCGETPIYDPFTLNINVPESFKASCPGLINGTKTFTSCATSIPYADIASLYPPGTIFTGPDPTGKIKTMVLITDYFSIDPSGKPTMYYVLEPGPPVGWLYTLKTQLGSCNMMTNPMIPTKFKTQ
ncbi:DUF11 domain-containing protein [Pedobacter nototheniae]|uniref:DUF11 domain-containing protein n=1 Tax=Pedobacter nototheniae TaxID=2488994 RepID=UPI00103C8E8A|nr:DUF11 domain-containing protein [Pedobacter nototheniae]